MKKRLLVFLFLIGLCAPSRSATVLINSFRFAAASNVYVFTAASDISTGSIDSFSVAASHSMPAGDYSVSFNCTINNSTGLAFQGAQLAMTGNSAVLTVPTDDVLACDHHHNDGTNLAQMCQATDADLALDSSLSMSFDANAHQIENCTSTLAVFTNPSAQTISFQVSTNTGCTFVAGSTITLTKL